MSPARAPDPRRALLLDMFRAAVAAARPDALLRRRLPPPPRGRTLVAGAGKAAAVMAAAVEEAWEGPLEGCVVVPYGHGAPCRRIEVVEAAHPVPDAAGARAARRILGLAHGLGRDDLLLCLLSGGASALLAAPAPGTRLADKRALTRALLRSGATIAEINCVRKHLSAVKGGRLAAAAHPARTAALLVSDVPGDDPAVIGSGPTVGDPTTLADARAVLARRGVRVPARAAERLRRRAAETPAPGAPELLRARAEIVARPQDALAAAAKVARAAGFRPLVLSDSLEGEARDAALAHAAIALQAVRRRQPAPPPLALLSGGETTVTLRGGERGARGGRNTEFLLAAAVALQGAPVHGIACDTDGIDGDGGHAGAVLDPTTLARAARRGLDPRGLLARHDSRAFFEALGDLVVTGPTRTNVNDFRAFLVPAE